MTVCVLNELPPSTIIWGGTGQAKVSRPIIEWYGSKIVAVFDRTPNLPPPFTDIELHCGWESFARWIRGRNRTQIGFCLAMGNPHGRARVRLHEALIAEGLRPISFAHPGAQIATNVSIGAGCQIMAGVVINPEARLGRQCIINTKASIDHECVLEDGVEIAPGATLCGLVHVRSNAWVCAGATILPRITLGEDSIAGAGAVVISDVPPGFTVVGVPANRTVAMRRIEHDPDLHGRALDY